MTIRPGNRLTAERLDSLAADPVSYTPVWTAASGTAPNLGTSTISAEYYESGPLLHFTQQITFAGATFGTGGAAWHFSLPVPMAASPSRVSATCQAFDASAVTIRGGFAWLTAENVGAEIFWMYTDGGGIWGATTPFTFANGDTLVVSGSYKPA